MNLPSACFSSKTPPTKFIPYYLKLILVFLVIKLELIYCVLSRFKKLYKTKTKKCSRALSFNLKVEYFLLICYDCPRYENTLLFLILLSCFEPIISIRIKPVRCRGNVKILQTNYYITSLMSTWTLNIIFRLLLINQDM